MRRTVIASGRVVAGALLWRRMIREFEAMGSFSGLTTVLLGAAYAAHAGWAVRGLVRAPATLPRPARTARAAGAAAGLSGSALALSGMARFESVAQLWGAEVGGLVSGGPYRFSRNPQYVGYVLAWVGAGLVRRSWHGLAAAASYAVAVRAWVPVEERNLRAELGAEYVRWAAGRPRWLGPLGTGRGGGSA
jgi:protein-S-isoprenylcysteine O-methyltransferase Ste14